MDDSQLALLSGELSSADGAVRQAVEHYAEIAGISVEVPATEIQYTPSSSLFDVKRFALDSANTLTPYRRDHTLVDAANDEHPFMRLLLLSLSPHWEDRVRAQALYRHLHNGITLPDQFPCIYEPIDSPKRVRELHPRPQVWVASPDEEMLHELLPLYEELWVSYESQWPETPNRTFVVGRLDGVSPHGVYRPGATPADVIASTLLTHDGMYARAPEHLKKMHPRYADFTRPPRIRAPKAATTPKESA